MIFDSMQSNMRVKDMMTEKVITVYENTSMREVKSIMRTNNISGMPVVDEEQVILGIVSIADIFQAMDDGQLEALVNKRMTKNVYTVRPDDAVNVALALFRNFNCGRLPVINEKKQVVGVITPNDIVRRLASYLKLDEIAEEKQEKISENLPEQQVLEFYLTGGDFNQAGFAASSLKRALQSLGIRPEVIRRAAIAAYEAEMNVVIHADKGVLQAIIDATKVEIIVKDQGPGIKDIEQAMKVGFSTAPDHVREMGFGAGMGLPNIKKSSDALIVNSVIGEGTELNIEIFFEGGK